MKREFLLFLTAFVLVQSLSSQQKPAEDKWSDNIQVILDNTKPLEYPRGKRLPLYLWPAIDPGEMSDAAAERLVRTLDERGVAIVCTWNTKDKEKSLLRAMTIAKAQKKLNQRINIDATSLLDSFFNGDERTAHIDRNGKPFFDDSFGPHKMGCPFAIDFRKKEIRDRVEFFVKKYKEAGLPVDFIFTDWEIDGPLEVNRAYEASKKCTRCTHYLGKNFTFEEFQKEMRNMRSYLVNYSYSSPVLAAFPKALVGNYAVYPNDGYRYWYDYFEYYVEGQPYKADQKAKYRKWYNDFPLTGFTFAMPVVYTWSGLYNWYDFENSDYRWFFNMLLCAGNAGKSTPQEIPVISFVHWNTIFAGTKPDSSIKQMSKEAYQELLWHMLLRGTDAFFMWSGKKEYPSEVRLVHQVWAEAQKFGDFLEKGTPVNFDLPGKPGIVISGLAKGDSLLVRRTDFGPDHDPVTIMAGTKPVQVPYAPGVCKILSMKPEDPKNK
jgi:hypothetical protein